MLPVPLIIEELLSCVWLSCGVGRGSRQRRCGVKGGALSQSVWGVGIGSWAGKAGWTQGQCLMTTGWHMVGADRKALVGDHRGKGL